jgi:signal transduction histidine kinase
MDSPPVRVLLVEDDEDDYLLTRDLLSEIEGNPYHLDWVKDYDAALGAIKEGRHAVCLLDYRLGPRTGLDLLREAVRCGCQAPVILLTGQGEREVDLEAMKAGAADYLVKGRIDASLLERAIRYALERTRDREALRQLHSDLERRVQERTAALATANEALQAEINERKRAEASLQEADRRKDQFLAMLAHELRNPLAPVRNGLQILKSARADREAVEKARAMMERQVGHMARIVDDLLDVSRITSGKIELRQERLDLARLVRVTVEDDHAGFEGSGLTTEAEVPEVRQPAPERGEVHAAGRYRVRATDRRRGPGASGAGCPRYRDGDRAGHAAPPV